MHTFTEIRSQSSCMNSLVFIGSTYMPDMPEDLGVGILGAVVGDGGGVGGNV